MMHHINHAIGILKSVLLLIEWGQKIYVHFLFSNNKSSALLVLRKTYIFSCGFLTSPLRPQHIIQTHTYKTHCPRRRPLARISNLFRCLVFGVFCQIRDYKDFSGFVKLSKVYNERVIFIFSRKFFRDFPKFQTEWLINFM